MRESKTPVREQEMRASVLFQDLPDAEIAWLLDNFRTVEYDQSERMFHRGMAADEMLLILEGKIEIFLPATGQDVPFFVLGPGRVTGALPYSRLREYAGSAFALEPTRCALLHRSQFQDLVQKCPELTQRLVAQMADRIRETTEGSVQREKLVALGRLSAGLAHELNNPAAAIRRSAVALEERVGRLGPVVEELLSRCPDPERIAALHRRREALREPSQAAAQLDPIARGEREDEITDWLESKGIAEPWKMAETFVESAVTLDDLEEATGGLDQESTGIVIAWFEGLLATDRLASELQAAAGRISDLVGSVKAYSHMDRGMTKDLTDLRGGIDATLLMLGHRIKAKQIAVVRDYPQDLELVPAQASALNQVWTNLIDNAIDVLPERGQIQIQVRAEGAGVSVRVIDDGPGIPKEVRSRIFDPFFTTKAFGEGSGLGLDIARRIIEDQHQGRIQVHSRPGRTEFHVWLPHPRTETPSNG